jgi:predicted metalloprotease
MARRKTGHKLSVGFRTASWFYAGVWTHYNQNEQFLGGSDIDEALSAAHAVGDDAFSQNSRTYCSNTHGTSQRKAWFMKGYKSGDINQGDTFAIR